MGTRKQNGCVASTVAGGNKPFTSEVLAEATFYRVPLSYAFGAGGI